MSHEIDWQDEPAPIAPGSKPDLIRCGLGSLPPLISLNSRHIGVELHFWQGRSFPHLKEGCPACLAKNVASWKGYIGVWNPATRLVGVMEFTLGCVSALDAYFLAHGTCRGASLVLKRAGNKANGKLSLTVSPSQWGLDQLPSTPDLRSQLQMMWGAKRLDEYITTKPGRAVVEAPTDINEVLERRRNIAAVAPGVSTNSAVMPLGQAAALVAAAMRVPDSNTPKNGKPQCSESKD